MVQALFPGGKEFHQYESDLPKVIEKAEAGVKESCLIHTHYVLNADSHDLFFLCYHPKHVPPPLRSPLWPS